VPDHSDTIRIHFSEICARYDVNPSRTGIPDRRASRSRVRSKKRKDLTSMPAKSIARSPGSRPPRTVRTRPRPPARGP
jgi:hypothetical protein